MQDEVDDREGRARLPMRVFLHLYYLDQKGAATEASRAVELAVVNVLAHLRGHAAGTSDEDGGSEGTAVSRLAFCGRSARVALFARFLGLRHDGLEPIPLEGLNVYLAALARVQKGAVPLLPLSGERVTVPAEQFEQALEWVFGQARTVAREQIKAGLAGCFAAEYGRVDLDAAMGYTLECWRDLVARFAGHPAHAPSPLCVDAFSHARIHPSHWHGSLWQVRRQARGAVQYRLCLRQLRLRSVQRGESESSRFQFQSI